MSEVTAAIARDGSASQRASQWRRASAIGSMRSGGVTRRAYGEQRSYKPRHGATPTADRRTTLAEITDEGRDVARRATLLLNADAFGLAALDDGEQEQLTELLRTLRLEAGDFEEAKNPA